GVPFLFFAADLAALRQEPGPNGAVLRGPATGAAATPLWLSKHLNLANLPVACLGSFASLSRGVHNLSLEKTNRLQN
ncbi:unnamed protein product, partial [Musa hybrid cultivar]